MPPKNRGIKGRLLIFGLVAVVIGVIVAVALRLQPRTEGIESDHRTAEQSGSSAPEPVDNLRELSAVVPDDSLGIREVVRAQGNVVGVTDDGVVGIDPASGEERWRYRVPGTEVTTGFPSEGDHVALAYVEGGIFREHVKEIVLDPLNGNITSSSSLPYEGTPDGLRNLVELGSANERVVVGDEVIVSQRGEGSGEIWSADPGDHCDGASPSTGDVNIASDATSVYLSVLCAEEGQAHLLSFGLASGAQQWKTSFDASGRESAPAILLAGFGPSYGTGSDPVNRALGGEIESEHLYIDASQGNPFRPEALKNVSLAGHFPSPGLDPEIAPGSFLLGARDSINMMVTYRVANILVDEGALDVHDFHEDVLVEENGSLQLIDDPLERSSDHTRNLIIDTLSEVEP